MIPADIVSIDFYKGGYSLFFGDVVERPILFYNFSAIKNYKNVSFILTSNKVSQSWSYGLKAFTWHEREAVEMVGARINRMKDNRNLLLDYGYFDRPVLKKNKLTKDNTIYYSLYTRSIQVSHQSRPII
jgi:NADH:ubiquinone oxidoreductase subunit C